jgi:hypothetical protein
MKKYSVLLFLVLFILAAAHGGAFAALPVKIKLDATTTKAMSIFISNFTELDMFEIPDVSGMTYDELVNFGVGHNFANNPKLIKIATGGNLSMDGKSVSESVKKYFALDFAPSVSAKYGGAEYNYSKGSYVFTIPAGRLIYYARVSEAFMDGSRILMTGEIYSKKDPKEVHGPFYAYAKPWKYGGKDTWALLSLHEGRLNEIPTVVTAAPTTKPEVSMPKPTTPADGEYMVIAEILPIMKTKGGKFVVTDIDGIKYLEYNEGIEGAAVFGNKLYLRPEAGWFALLSPEDGKVLGYIPADGVEPFPDFEPTNGALYMVARDNPELSLVRDSNKPPFGNFALLKGEIVPSLGRRDGKVILSFSTLDGEEGVGGRFVWADEKDLIALASYQPNNKKADRNLIPSVRRLSAYGNENEKIEELPKQFVDSLEKRAFLIDDKPLILKHGVFVDDMADLYQATKDYEADFITTDIFLHSFHLLFDQMLQKFERTYMAPKLAENLTEIIGFLDTARKHIEKDGFTEQGFNIAYEMLTVTRVLLSEKPNTSGLSSRAKGEINKIVAASVMENSEITAQKIDYSLFKPRGHYTLTPEFERYFLAVSYLGLAELQLRDKDENLIMPNIAAAAVISLALDAHIKTWEKFENSMNFLVGVPNAGDPKLFREIVRNCLGGKGMDSWKLLNNDTELSKLAMNIMENVPGPKIQSVVGIDKEGSDFENRDVVFRISPKRFTYDAYIMNWLTSPRVGTDEKPRNLPKGTDVMAVFGSSIANALSKSDYDVKNYETNLLKLKDEVAGYLAKENTVYASWLEAFRAGFDDSGSEQFFYRNAGWQWKKLATNLASWAELKRDTILYAEQSMAEMGDGGDWYAGRFEPPQPRGYVEPDPQFFTAMLNATNFLLSFIKEYGVESNDDEDEVLYSERLGKFSEMLTTMKNIAQKQVAKETLSPLEYAAIKETARAFDDKLLLPVHSAVFNLDEGELRKMAIIADVATDGLFGRVLEVGVGVPRAIYVFANDQSGGARVTKGYVFSYYEFEHPVSKRMTDEEWRAIVYDPARAEELEKFRPSWHEEYKKNTK